MRWRHLAFMEDTATYHQRQIVRGVCNTHDALLRSSSKPKGDCWTHIVRCACNSTGDTWHTFYTACATRKYSLAKQRPLNVILGHTSYEACATPKFHYFVNAIRGAGVARFVLSFGEVASATRPKLTSPPACVLCVEKRIEEKRRAKMGQVERRG